MKYKYFQPPKVVPKRFKVTVQKYGDDDEPIEVELSEWVYENKVVEDIHTVIRDWGYNYFDKHPFKVLEMEEIHEAETR